MKIIKITIVLAILLSITNLVIGQKLISDGYKISYKSFQKQAMSTCGKKSDIFTGIIKVKTKNELKGEYPFYFAEMSSSIYLLVIKNTENKIIAPKIQYDTKEKILYCFKGSEKEIKEKQNEDKLTEDIILSGMLIWLKSKF